MLGMKAKNCPKKMVEENPSPNQAARAGRLNMLRLRAFIAILHPKSREVWENDSEAKDLWENLKSLMKFWWNSCEFVGIYVMVWEGMGMSKVMNPYLIYRKREKELRK